MTNDLKFTTAGDYMNMNERIEDLAEQANLKLDELPDDTFIPLEKFAELIVRECVKVCHKMAEDSDSYVVHDGDTCAEQIKQHFGVE